MEVRKLNALRGIAALIVVISHYSNTTSWLGGYLGHGAGQTGVMLFFLLSGFLMSFLYLAKPFNKAQVGRYLVARLARIIPLFFAVVGVSYLLEQLGVKGLFFEIENGVQLLHHLLLISGVNVLWTIPPEVQFYGLFVFMWWIASKWSWSLWVFITVSFAVIYYLGFPLIKLPWFGSIVGLPILSSLPYFFVGVLMGQLYRVWIVPQWMMSNGFVLALVFVPLLYPKIYKTFWPEGHQFWQDIEVLAVISGVFFMVVFLVPASNRLLSNAIGDFLGKISFSLYLLHLPVLHLLEGQAKLNPSIYLPLYLFFSIMVAYLAYLYLECPSRAAVRGLPAKLSQSRLPLEGAAKQ